MKHAIVMKGEQFDFVCNASKEIDSCSINFVNLGQSFKVRDSAKKEKYEYFGKGFSKGDCGIRYFNTTADMQGTITCKVGFAGEDQEIYESIELKVGIPMTLVELSANNKNFEFIEDDEMIFNCSAFGADPLPYISVFIGEILMSFLNAFYFFTHVKLSILCFFFKRIFRKFLLAKILIHI
jgi:hypothetical protein